MALAAFWMFFFFFFNDTATTEIYTLSLHDALLILVFLHYPDSGLMPSLRLSGYLIDRKSTRLNSSHLVISYAVFCLKKKKNSFFSHPSQQPPRTALSLHSISRQRSGHQTGSRALGSPQSAAAERVPLFFFFNDTATTEIYTLSLHDALPICVDRRLCPRAISARWRASR